MSDFLLMVVANHLVQGVTLTVLVAELLRRWHGLNAASRHDLWLLVLAVLVSMPALAWLPRPLPQETPAPAVIAEAGPLSLSGVLETDPSPSTGGEAPPPAVSRAAGDPAQVDWLMLLSGGWLLGAGALLGRLALAAWRSLQLYREAHSAPADFQRRMDRLTRAAGIRRQVPIRLTEAVSAPATVGVLRCWVALPTDVSRMSEQNVNDALHHELAHVVRRDPLIALVQRIACAVFFFHPAIWFVSRRMEAEREVACDDWAIARAGGTGTYAGSLVDFAEAELQRRRPLLAVRCLDSKHELRLRIAHLLDRNVDHGPRTRAVVALPLGAALLALLVAAQAWPQPPQTPRAQGVVPERSQAAMPAPSRAVADVPISPEHELLHAVWHEDLRRVDALIAAGGDLNQVYARRGSPRTALNAAARTGNIEVIERLLAAGADANIRVNGDAAALTEAIRGGHAAAARLLLARGADADARNQGDPSPLIAAAARGSVALMTELMDRGADPNGVVRGDGSPLIAAARHGHAEAVRALLERGADPDLGVRGDDWPLYHAAVRGDLEITRLLVDAGVDVDRSFPGDGTPLMLAIRHGHSDVAELLIRNGARPDIGSTGDGNPLIEAVRSGDERQLRALIAAGADVDAAVRGDGNALINASRLGRLDLVRALVDAGAHVNVHLPGDDTPLINAVRSGSCELVQYLLAAGADVDGTGDREDWFEAVRTPLNQARDPTIVAVLEGRSRC